MAADILKLHVDIWLILSLLAGKSAAAQAARQLIESKGKSQYSFLECPDNIAANCLYVNGTLIHASEEAFPNSYPVFEQLSGPKVALSASELNKVDGCFTCCSVLIK